MSAAHTPGPWIQAGPSFGDSLPRYTNCIITEYENEDEGFIEICEMPFAHKDEENEANARLIAAAPELLEALETLVALLPDPELDTDAVQKKIVEQARTAIAKATGRQP